MIKNEQYIFSHFSLLSQHVKEELKRRAAEPSGSCGRTISLDFHKSDKHEDFLEHLTGAAKLTCTDNPTDLHSNQDNQCQ